MTPYFSIVIPTYNRGYVIGMVIESLLNQNFKDWELIIVDDGSSDNTEDIVKNFEKSNKEKILYFKFSNNKGVNIARNFGASKAKGKWLIFQDSDDLFTDSALDIIYQLTISVDVPLIFTSCISQEGKILTSHPNFEGYMKFEDLLCEKIRGEYLPCVKREVFLCFKFPEDIKGGEGILWRMIAREYGRIYVSNRITRIYNNKLSDRLSVKKRNFKRLYKVTKKYLEIFGSDYIKYCPFKFIEKILKMEIYKIFGGLKF